MLCTHVCRTRLKWCKIATFGFSAGVTKEGYRYKKNPCFLLLDVLCKHNVPTSIYVGIPPNEQEMGAESPTLLRINKTKEVFKNISFYKTPLHSKMILFSDGYGMFGSLNFTGSSLGDCILVGYITNCCDTPLFDFFERNIANEGVRI